MKIKAVYPNKKTQANKIKIKQLIYKERQIMTYNAKKKMMINQMIVRRKSKHKKNRILKSLLVKLSNKLRLFIKLSLLSPF